MSHRAGWLDPIFVGLSAIGSFGAVWLVLALVLALLWRRPWLFVVVVAGFALAEGVTGGMKAAIGRPRPAVRFLEPAALVQVPTTGSFPSGHAAVAFACATLVALEAPRLAVPVLLLACAIAYSRVYVGVHYPLDVLAGALVGVVVATALRLLAAAPPRSRAAPRRG